MYIDINLVLITTHKIRSSISTKDPLHRPIWNLKKTGQKTSLLDERTIYDMGLL